MHWPRLLRSASRAALEERVHALQGQLQSAQADAAYWRTRCERLIDAALAKRGEITSPTMVDVKPATDHDSVMRGLFGGLALNSLPLQTERPGQDAGRRASPTS